MPNNNCDNSDSSSNSLAFYNFMIIERMIELNAECLEDPTSLTIEYFQDQIEDTKEYITTLKNMMPDAIDRDLKLICYNYLPLLYKHKIDLTFSLKKLLKEERQSEDIGGGVEVLLDEPSSTSQLNTLPASDGNVETVLDNTQTHIKEIVDNVDHYAELFRELNITNTNPFELFQQMVILLSTLPELKHRFQHKSWMILVQAAHQTKAFVHKLAFVASQEDKLTLTLIKKLPPKYEAEFRLNFPSEGYFKLENFILLCDMYVDIIVQRIQQGMPTDTVVIPEELCLICGTDYHYPKECDLTINERTALVMAQGKCQRCFQRGDHQCDGIVCPYCTHDHHLALCLFAPINFE